MTEKTIDEYYGIYGMANDNTTGGIMNTDIEFGNRCSGTNRFQVQDIPAE